MYPKLINHPTDRNSSVVVANAEQEAELPADWLTTEQITKLEDAALAAPRRGRPPATKEE